MAKRETSSEQPVKPKRYILGRESFAKISAVEGIHLTDAMKERAKVKRSKGLTTEQYRRTIIADHCKS